MNTLKTQAQILAYLLKKEEVKGELLPKDKQKGVKLFRHFTDIDADLFEASLSFGGVDVVLRVLGRYFSKFSDLPSQDLYNQIKTEHTYYKTYRDRASKEELYELDKFERMMFEPIENESYIADKIINLLSEDFLLTLKEGENEKLEECESSLDVVSWGADQRREFFEKLKAEVYGEDMEVSDIAEGSMDASTFEDTKPIRTCYDLINLYERGITVVLSAAKAGKTALAQNITLGLAKEGCNVYYLDLENGLNKMKRRFAQLLLNCPKEWLFAGVYIDEEELPEGYGKIDKNKEYSRGEQVYKIIPREDEEEGWSLEIKFLRAMVELASGSNPDDWEEVEEDFNEENIFLPIQPELDKKLRRIKRPPRLERMAGATPKKVRKRIRDLYEEGFFKKGEENILIIDWLHLMGNDNKKLLHWEASRENYKQLKEIRDEFNVSMLAIEGLSNPESAMKPDVKKQDLKVKGNTQILYDAESIVGFLYTQEEQEKGFRRLMLTEDRDRESGTHVVEFLKFEGESFKIQTITEEDHRENIQDFWGTPQDGISDFIKGY